MKQISIKKTTSFLFVLRLFRMSLSIVTLPLTAKYFGVSMERDAWIMTTTFFSFVGLAFWGPIDETFRAKFVLLKENEGEDMAMSRAVSLVGFTILISIIISLIILFFINDISQSLDQTASQQKLSLFITLMLVMLPTLLINQVTSIGISILNAFDIYYLPELVGAFASICNLLFILFLAPLVGIFSLAISQYVSILVLLIAVIIHLKKQTFKISSWHFIYWNDVKIFVIFALPFYAPYVAGQISLLVEKLIANSLGVGSLSLLDYARQFSMLMQAVISSVLTTVMVPQIAKNFAQGDKITFSNTIKESISSTFVIMCLTIPILIGSATPLSRFFFEHGRVTKEDLLIIINLMRFYGFALIGVIIYLFFGLILLASDKGKKYAFWGILAQLIVISLNIILVSKLGLYIFPISFGISHIITAFILSFFVEVDDKRFVFISILKYTLILLIISFILYFLNFYPLTNILIIQLLFNGFVLLFLIVIFSKFLDISIISYFKKYFFKDNLL